MLGISKKLEISKRYEYYTVHDFSKVGLHLCETFFNMALSYFIIQTSKGKKSKKYLVLSLRDDRTKDNRR